MSTETFAHLPPKTGAQVRLAFSRPLLLWVIAAVGLLTFAARNGLLELIQRWAADEAYSHGFVMPLIIAFFIIRDREIIARTAFQPAWSGVIIVAFALAAFSVAELSQTYSIVHYAYFVALCGLVWATMGRASTYVLVPISLLVFAIPLPVFTQATLTADLQLLSSQLGAALIRALGIPVFLDGNIIDLGVYRLHVAEACAGLNYLFPLLGIGHLCAYLFKAPAWKRVLLVASTIPLTVLMNVARIVGVGLLVRAYGPEAAEGFLHYFQGWLVFMLSTVILIGEMALLNRIGGARMPLAEMFDLRSSRTAAPAANEAAADRVQYRSVPLPLIASTLLIIAAMLFTVLVDRRPDVIPERTDFVLFPTFLGDWTGRRTQLDAESERALAADDYLSSVYVHPDQSQAVELFVAYYASQRQGQRPHSPQVCLPGGGWEIETIERAEAALDRMSLPHNRVVMRQGNQRLLAYYWFEQRGQVFANEYLMRWDLFAGGLASQRRDGAMVRVVTPIDGRESLEAAGARLDRFLLAALPALPAFLPE